MYDQLCRQARGQGVGGTPSQAAQLQGWVRHGAADFAARQPIFLARDSDLIESG